MRGRRVILSVDGQDVLPMSITTGLPQGSPVSPAFSGVYMADIHWTVEERVLGARGISFMDNVTWFFEGGSVEEATRGLERYAAEGLRWAKSNMVQFKTSNIEAVPLPEVETAAEVEFVELSRSEIEKPCSHGRPSLARGLAGLCPHT